VFNIFLEDIKMLELVKQSRDSKISIPVLCVEDDEDTLHGLAIILGRKIEVVDIAYNGKDGLEKFVKNRYDIVVTDIRMPHLNGIELAKKIKSIKPQTKIIMTTAYSDTKYFMQCIDIGVSKYILKPIDVKILIAAISEYSFQILAEKELKISKAKKEDAIHNVLKNFIPICPQCMLIKSEDGWVPIESFIISKFELSLNKELCPSCKSKILTLHLHT
jgi:YesN/AraC family two-component response regulator